MKLTSESRFIVTNIKTGHKTFPKGIYFNHKNLVIVGSVEENHTIRWSVRAEEYDVEVV